MKKTNEKPVASVNVQLFEVEGGAKDEHAIQVRTDGKGVHLIGLFAAFFDFMPEIRNLVLHGMAESLGGRVERIFKIDLSDKIES